MSGYLEYDTDSRELLEQSLFLEKPFSRRKLIEKIEEALANRPARETLASKR